MDKVLELYFITADEKTAKIQIEDPVEPVDEAKVRAAMNEMIASQAFKNSAGPYVSAKEARLVATTKTTYLF
ncbi:hypothetical protein AC622_11985 [Bacillus sp. FJAT-27916]|uniref:DUF2922 domain-containing protein n=1 Tax=Bacillus sp. FJAT-27916 TaxID=1679169 RepID=UPI0006713079|nr:DUF2922 domain-containing protein [Bacillus sp. FJAT-27916]KMY44849.1 hypothetical protein AC622_11985 [Bacillus sp. FJAT-27916]